MNQTLEHQWELCSQKMEHLMQRLPEMNALNQDYGRCQLAASLIEAEEQLQLFWQEQARQQQQYRKYQAEGNQGMAAYIQNEQGYRMGPIKEQQERVQSLLKKSGFRTVDEARAFLPAPEVLNQMEYQIKTFQKDYAETFAECRRLDGLLSSQEHLS